MTVSLGVLLLRLIGVRTESCIVCGPTFLQLGGRLGVGCEISHRQIGRKQKEAIARAASGRYSKRENQPEGG